jgi:hypothetical protein
MPPWQKSGELPYSHGRLSSVVCAMLPLRPAITMCGALTAHGSGQVFLAFGYFVQISLNLSCMYYTTPWKYCNPQKAGKGVSLWRAKAVQRVPVQNDPNCPAGLEASGVTTPATIAALAPRWHPGGRGGARQPDTFVLSFFFPCILCARERTGGIGVCSAGQQQTTGQTIQTNQPAEQAHEPIAIGDAAYDDTLR